MSTLANLFSNILLIFTNLLHLKFYPLNNLSAVYLSFIDQTPRFDSSTLVELHVNVYCLDDCLYFLDGRLPHLHTLFVQVHHLNSVYPPTTMNKVNSFQKHHWKNSLLFLLLSRRKLVI